MLLRIILGMLMVFTAGFAHAVTDDQFTETKNIRKALAADQNTSVEITNKYGNVEVENWDKDSVVIAIEVKASAKKLDVAWEMVESTNFNIGGNRSYVFAETTFGSNGSFIKKGFQDLNYQLNGNRELQVNYKVFIPEGCRLVVNNKFGNILLPNLTGAVRIDLAHGDLRAPSIAESRNLTVKYGKVNIRELMKGRVQVEYAELYLDLAGEIEVSGRASEIHIEEAEKLTLSSQADKLYLGRIGSLDGRCRLSTVKVDELKENLNLNTNYGSLTVDRIGPDCRNVFLSGNFTDFMLAFDPFLPFAFEVQLDAARQDFLFPASDFEVVEKDDWSDVRTWKGFRMEKENSTSVFVKSKNRSINFMLAD